MAVGVARRAALAAGRILCGATVSPAGTRLAPAAARDLLSPAARLLATGRSGPFAVPHPKRTDTLRFPARSLMSKGADPLSPASSGPAAGAGRPVTVFDSLFTAVKFTIAGLALLEATLYASTEFTKPPSEEQSVTNWSGTKEVPCARYVQPEDFAQLKAAVEWAHVHRRRLRPVGSALSPNGAAFNPEGMISLAMLDQIVSVDEKAMTVTVQAGARVLELVEALRPFGLTLANYASIREQQIGGFTQVGAHGTGARVPPLDETVTALKLVTPGEGVLELSDEKDKETFRMARCGVGALGVAAEVTLQCVRAHRLLEKTWTTTRAEVEKNHAKWLANHQHIRYMWIPHTDSVVVVGSNPLPEGAAVPKPTSAYSEARKTEPMVRLLREVAPEVDATGMGFGQLRDELLKVAPLDLEHVKRVNRAEAEFWKRNAGTRCDWSDQILGFDCGGQQHVYEVAFRTGDSPEANTGKDLEYMRELMQMIEREGIPAPAPIEQRWSSGSKSPLSPASNDGDESSPGLHSWIGIIMYLPTDDETERDAITRAFKSYAAKEEATLGEKYRIRTHWAKIELPEPERSDRGFRVARERMAQLYPVEEFRKIRARLDPKGILGNDPIEALLGEPNRVPVVAKREVFGEQTEHVDEIFRLASSSRAKWDRGEYVSSLIDSFAQMVLAVRSTYDMFGRSMRAEKEKRDEAEADARAQAERMLATAKSTDAEDPGGASTPAVPGAA